MRVIGVGLSGVHNICAAFCQEMIAGFLNKTSCEAKRSKIAACDLLILQCIKPADIPALLQIAWI
jgi:hypothetical protein